jgi:rfaE bifunctional protein kinase chain/domain
MEVDRIRHITNKIKEAKVSVFGDFCIDAYWGLNPNGSEISKETGLMGEAVEKQYYNLGGASNIVANLAALEPASIKIVGVVGDDIFGRELVRQMQILGVDTTYLITQKDNFSTVTFGKRYLNGKEKSRIDFGFFNKKSESTNKKILEGLRAMIKTSDVLIFNQQVPRSIDSKSFINKVNSIFKKFNEKIILLDTRDYGKDFKHTYMKTNIYEALLLKDYNLKIGDHISDNKIKTFAENIYLKFKKPVFITRGSKGIIVYSSRGYYEALGINLLSKMDSVGAGDTTTSALALCLAVDIEPWEAAEFANLASAVTVQKLYQTGTASAEEILETGKDVDYIYQPELANDLRKANYYKNSQIELCTDINSIPFGQIKHIFFDNDGTISTLRQGWENIMAPFMISAILGEEYENVDKVLYQEVTDRVNNYIDKSTGIQTILQTEALVHMVYEFKIVPGEKILNKSGYKKIYNDKLMGIVNKRINKMKNGELEIIDFIVKGALEFLKVLMEKGIKLYLISGTDKEDVINEANKLGYAKFFEGRIYGAVGDISKYSKKMVIEKVINENHLSGPELAVFGDGPVEIRECSKRKGITIGVASDEKKRHGLNPKKRKRLIESGADIIIPDFSQISELMKILFGEFVKV